MPALVIDIIETIGAKFRRRWQGRPMLVLSRKTDESIVIGDCVVVTVIEIRGDKVRLGIQAPKEIPVHRQEVFDAIKRSMSQENNPDSSG